MTSKTTSAPAATARTRTTQPTTGAARAAASPATGSTTGFSRRTKLTTAAMAVAAKRGRKIVGLPTVGTGSPPPNWVQ